MKKWIVLATTSLMMASAHANQTWCGYKDYFRLSDTSHPNIYIKSGHHDTDLLLQFVGPRSFVIRDTEDNKCKTGYAHVTVVYEKDWCVLDIKDGPYINHPTVNASCNGLRYINTVYDGIGTHTYTINLD